MYYMVGYLSTVSFKGFYFHLFYYFVNIYIGLHPPTKCLSSILIEVIE